MGRRRPSRGAPLCTERVCEVYLFCLPTAHCLLFNKMSGPLDALHNFVEKDFLEQKGLGGHEVVTFEK